MGLFSKKPEPKPEPVRRDTVRKLIKLGMQETDAADHIAPGCSERDEANFRRAKAARDAAYRNATQAEMRAAHEALRRHGY